jgi:4-hydroxybenzoate polyprenyltransferase
MPAAGTAARTPPAAAVIRLLRPYQWLKNTLVFLPFLLAHEYRDFSRWSRALMAFAVFSLVASAGYILNDVLDRRADRLHPRRRFRPVASGDVSPGWAMAILIPLLAGAAALCLFLPPACALVAGGYLALAAAYSWKLKHALMADVIILGLLYTCRLFMGAAATADTVSTWLAAFSICFFLSLALCKRVSELLAWQGVNKDHAPGRRYHSQDIPALEMMAAASGFLSCLVAVFYVQSTDILRLYRHPQFLWGGVIALLYWIGRLILYTHRGQCPDDPLFFVLQDRTSLVIFVLVLVLVTLAL